VCEGLLAMSGGEEQLSEKIAILAARVDNSEKNAKADVENTEKILKEKMENTENIFKQKMDNLESSIENKVFRNFFNFLGAASLILAVAGVLGYKVNADNFNALKENINSAAAIEAKKIEEFISGVTIERGSIRSATNDIHLQAYITYAPDNDEEGHPFKISFNFPLFIDAIGKGVGDFIGLKITVGENLNRIFASKVDGSLDSVFFELNKKGIYYNLEKSIPIMEGLSYQYTAEYHTHRISCGDVQAVINSVVGKSYDIEVQPFIAKTISGNQSFHVTFVDDSLFQCKK